MIRFFFALLLCLGLVQPAMAFELENNLATEPEQTHYNFPADFRDRVERIEKAHGLQFHIYTVAAEFPASAWGTGRIGADQADAVASSLINQGRFDPQHGVVIAWVRNAITPLKGSVGVAPGGLLKSAGVNAARLSGSSGLIVPILKENMPQDPSAAIVAIAAALDQQIGESARMAELNEWVAAFALAAVAVIGLGFLLVELQVRYQEWRRSREAKTKAYDCALQNLNRVQSEQSAFHLMLLSDPLIVQDMQTFLPNDPKAHELIAEYQAHASAYSSAYKAISTFFADAVGKDDETQANTTEWAESIPRLIAAELTARQAVDTAIGALVKIYGQYFDVMKSADPDAAMTDMLPLIPPPVRNPWSGMLSSAAWGKEWEKLTPKIPLEPLNYKLFHEFSVAAKLFQVSIDEHAQLLADIERLAAQADEHMRAIKIFQPPQLSPHTVSPMRTEMQQLGYVLDELKQATPPDSDLLQAMYEAGRFLEVHKKLVEWHDANSAPFSVLMREMNSIADRDRIPKQTFPRGGAGGGISSRSTRSIGGGGSAGVTIGLESIYYGGGGASAPPPPAPSYSPPPPPTDTWSGGSDFGGDFSGGGDY